MSFTLLICKGEILFRIVSTELQGAQREIMALVYHLMHGECSISIIYF